MKTLKLTAVSAIFALYCITNSWAQESSKPTNAIKKSEKIQKPEPLKNNKDATVLNEENISEPNSKLLNRLFKRVDSNEFELNPSLFKQVTEDKDLIGMKVLFKKENKIYRYLGNQDQILELLNSSSFKEKECTDCTTRTCESGTVYTCGCHNGWCVCPLCADIIKLKDIQ